METLFKDLRYGIRNLWKQPVFALIAVSTLALAIGGNSAMFSVVNAVLLRPLQYPESDRIVVLEGINPGRGITQSNMSVPDLGDWQSQNQVFEQMAGFQTGGLILNNGEETERVRGGWVSADFFTIFRTPSLLGRTIQPSDMQSQSNPIAVIGYGLWQRRFGANPNVVNTQVMISGKSLTVVGVMPQGFDYPAQSEAWVPFPLEPTKERRDNRYVNVVARLKPGVNVAQAQAQLDTINQRLAQSYTETNTGWSVRVSRLQDQMVGNVRSPLIIRLALGAQMSDVLRLVLKGGMALAVIGIGLGLAGAVVLTRWLTTLLFGVKPIDWLTFSAVSVSLLLTTLLACYLPARRATKVDPLVALRYD